jgi:hypothetical protein
MRRMAQVVCKSGCFGYVRVESANSFGFFRLFASELFSHPACKLGYFQGVCKPIMKDVATVGRHDLRNLSETRESARVLDAVPVNLSGCAIIAAPLGAVS